MEKLGFGRTWIRWIITCVTSASMSILLNGSPLKPFNMEKGLRQGDPLSPYLFILISEALVHLLKKAEGMNLIQAVHIGKDQVTLKHLQFADDILIFAPKNTLCITNYFRILDVFAIMSGLNLNYSKSNFISWNSGSHDWAKETATLMGCRHATCPFTYLGFSLGDHMNKGSAWIPVIEKIQGRLATWKAKVLSRAGRLTLIKSVLNTLPVYYMSMFKMPKSVASKIVAIQRRFFWGGIIGDRKGCPRVKWSIIQLPKEMGGLGIGNIMHKNLILLFKWWWRYSDSGNTLWKKILKSVHDIKGLKASSDAFNRVRDGTWAQLMSNDIDTARVRSIIEEGMQIKVEDGKSVRFWHDRWCEAGSLKSIFPRLYSISLQKNYMISQMGEWQEETWNWHLIWRRYLYDWENDEVSNLKSLIAQKRLIRDTEDGVLWRHSGSQCYPVNSIATKMFEESTPTISRSVTNIVWQNFIPPRAQLYVWLANLDKLNTGDFLAEKGIIDAQMALCPFCNLITESNSHILFTCRFSWYTWMSMLKWWSISGPLNSQCSRFNIEWVGMVKKKTLRKVWGLILGCVIWSLWRERNKIRFENGSPNINNFVYSLKVRIGIWTKEMLGLPGWSSDDVTHNINSLLMYV